MSQVGLVFILKYLNLMYSSDITGQNHVKLGTH